MQLAKSVRRDDGVAVVIDAVAYALLLAIGWPSAVARTLSAAARLAGPIIRAGNSKPPPSAWTVAALRHATITMLLSVAVNAIALDLLMRVGTGAATLLAFSCSVAATFLFDLFARLPKAPIAPTLDDHFDSAAWRRTLRDYAPFTASALYGGGVLLYRLPSIYRDGELWAESATNYFLHAHYHSFLDNVRALDFGYLPWFSRISAFLVYLVGIPATLAPYAYGVVALVSVSFAASCLALPQCRRLIPSDLARFVICLALSSQTDYELKTMVNMSYYGVIPLFIMLALLPLAPALTLRQGLLAGAFAALLCLSKPFFIAFAPAAGLLFLWAVVRRNLPIACFSALTTVSAAAQAAIMWLNKATVDHHVTLDFTAKRQLIVDYARVLSAMTLFGEAGKPRPGVAFFADITPAHVFAPLLLVAVALTGLRSWSQARTLAWPMAACLLTLAAGMALAVLSFPHLAQQDLASHDMTLVNRRWFFVATVMALFAIAIPVARGSQRMVAASALAVWLWSSAPFGISRWPEEQWWPSTGGSAWQVVGAKVFSQPNPRGCVPINPFPWVLGFDCGVLERMAYSATLASPSQTLPTAGPVRAPRSAAHWQVDLIGLPIEPDQAVDTLLIARDQEGRELAKAPALTVKPMRLSYFHFPEPLRGVASVELLRKGQPAALPSLPGTPVPQWIWYGRSAG